MIPVPCSLSPPVPRSLSLTLTVLPQKGYGEVTLMDCLRLFTKEDVLDGDEKPVQGRGAPWGRLGPFPSMPVLPGLWAQCPHPPACAVCLPQTCCRCKARKRCTKKFSIQKFPKILVLRILRDRKSVV